MTKRKNPRKSNPGKGMGEEGAPVLTLAGLAERLGGRLIGDGRKKIGGVGTLTEAGPEMISFAISPHYFDQVHGSRAGAFLVPEPVKDLSRPQIVVPNVYLALSYLIRMFFPEEEGFQGVSALAWVSESAMIGPGAAVHPLAYIGDGAEVGEGSVIYPQCYIGPRVKIGKECRIYSRVSVREGVRIGNRVIIQDGAVIGSDGFGFARDGAEYRKIPQAGGVEIGDEVEIGANVTIDRATLGTTKIGRGTKIDNLVQVAHNVEIGENSIMAAQVGIAGSSRLGPQVVLGGQAGVGDHVEIGAGAQVAGQSGVMKNVGAGARVGGVIPMPIVNWLRVLTILPELPEMKRELATMVKRLARLEGGKKEKKAKGTTR